MTSFIALEIALELATAVAAPLARVRAADADLADQLRTAVQSVALNLAEGSGRDGKDRRKHFRYAHGSLLEARTALRLAALWGYLDAARYADAERLADRLAGMLWRLTR
jgi:four helix bundle protein